MGTNTGLVALLAAALVAGAVGALAAAVLPAPQRADPRPLTVALTDGAGLAVAIVVAVVVLLATRWPVGALAAGLLAASWKWLFVSDESAADRDKVRAIAKWLEDLRDVVRRSSVGIETALEMVGETTQGPLAEPLGRFVLRRRQGTRIGAALVELADAVDHPTFDSAAAAIVLVVDGSAGGARLYDTLDELALAARDEARAREEIDRVRRIYQRSMRRLLIIMLVFIGMLTAFAGDFLASYATTSGQLWLMVPCAVWAGCLVWIRRLADYDMGPRYRINTVVEEPA